jgi:enamine deaminase RidA (YjgF/YER057c/UK114 family)
MAQSPITYLNPPSAPPVQGLYSHVTRVAPGELAFIAGQVAIDQAGNPVGVGDMARQVQQVFANLGLILRDLGVDFGAVVQFTTYLTRADGIAAFMATRGEIFPKLFAGGKYPPNTLLVVERLVKPEFLVEVEAIARLPG